MDFGIYYPDSRDDTGLRVDNEVLQEEKQRCATIEQIFAERFTKHAIANYGVYTAVTSLILVNFPCMYCTCF